MLVFILTCFGINSEEIRFANRICSSFVPPIGNDYYFRAADSESKHILTFSTDSTFHITLMNESGSCWTWGDYSGVYQTNFDTVTFEGTIYDWESNPKVIRETFIWTREKYLMRISEGQLMFDKYKLKERKNNRRMRSFADFVLQDEE